MVEYCKCCGKEFEKTSNNKKFCTLECKDLFYGKIKKPDTFLPCPKCGAKNVNYAYDEKSKCLYVVCMMCDFEGKRAYVHTDLREVIARAESRAKNAWNKAASLSAKIEANNGKKVCNMWQ